MFRPNGIALAIVSTGLACTPSNRHPATTSGPHASPASSTLPATPPRAAPPAAPAASATPTTPAEDDLRWLVDGREGLIVTVEDERKVGLGADFVRRELDLITPPRNAPSWRGTVTRVSRGVDIYGTPPSARVALVNVPAALTTTLFAALARARSRPPRDRQVIVTSSDTYLRVTVRVRTFDDTHEVEVFTAPSDRPDPGWHLGGRGRDVAGVDLDPAELNAAFALLEPYLQKADPPAR